MFGPCTHVRPIRTDWTFEWYVPVLTDDRIKRWPLSVRPSAYKKTTEDFLFNYE